MRIYFISYREGLSPMTEHAYIGANSKEDAIAFCNQRAMFINSIFEVDAEKAKGSSLQKLFVV